MIKLSSVTDREPTMNIGGMDVQLTLSDMYLLDEWFAMRRTFLHIEDALESDVAYETITEDEIDQFRDAVAKAWAKGMHDFSRTPIGKVLLEWSDVEYEVLMDARNNERTMVNISSAVREALAADKPQKKYCVTVDTPIIKATTPDEARRAAIEALKIEEV